MHAVIINQQQKLTLEFARKRYLCHILGR